MSAPAVRDHRNSSLPVWLGSLLSRRACLALAACAALLQGCTLSPAPIDHYYRLSAENVDFRFSAPRLTGTLRVRRPRAEALTDGTHLLYRRADNPSEIHREPYQHWTDAPSLLLHDALLSTLHSAGLADRVVPPALRTPIEFTLSTRLTRLERLIESGSERVTVELEFSLVRERDRSLLFHESYADSDQIDGVGAPEAVEAYDRALSRILQRLLVDLDQKLPSEVAGLLHWRP